MIKRALILVDVQNDYFPGGKWTLSGIDAAVRNAARLLDASRQAGDLIVHIRHESLKPDAPFFVAGSAGAQIHTSVQPRDGEPVVLKNFINAFRETELKNILDRNGIVEVVICGAMSHFCVDAVTRAAADFGYAVTLIHDACATRDLDFNGTVIPAAQVHGAFMAALGQGYAKVFSTDAFLQTDAKAA